MQCSVYHVLFIEGIDDSNEITCFLFFFLNNDKRVKIQFTIIFNHYFEKKNKLYTF